MNLGGHRSRSDRPPEAVSPDDWPILPENPEPLNRVPVVGTWVWTIPDVMRLSGFHQVRAVETIADEEGTGTIVVESVCRGVWPLDQLAACVPDRDPILRRSAPGRHAACRACVEERRIRQGHWARRLAEHRRIVPHG